MRGPKGMRRGMQLSELGMIPDGAVLIRDGIIQEVGPSRRVEALAEARGATEIDATGRVVMPGLVDSHTHLIFPPALSAAGPVGETALRTLLSTTAQRLAHRGRGHLEALARHGTTTVEAKTGCGPLEPAETKILRVLHVLQGHPLDVIPTFLFRPCLPGLDAGVAEWVLNELMPKIRRRNLARFADVLWDNEPEHEPLFRRFLETARSLGFVCKIHAERSAIAGAVAAAVGHSVVSIDHVDGITAGDQPVRLPLLPPWRP